MLLSMCDTERGTVTGVIYWLVPIENGAKRANTLPIQLCQLPDVYWGYEGKSREPGEQ